jgi:hypothetical protein
MDCHRREDAVTEAARFLGVPASAPLKQVFEVYKKGALKVGAAGARRGAGARGHDACAHGGRRAGRSGTHT